MVDSIKMKRLVILKQIFTQGQVHRQSRTQTSNMLACHHYDLCIEMLLRMICTDLNIKLKPKEDSFWHIWELVNNEVTKKFKVGLPLSHEIEPLRVARNSIQHYGTVPSDSDVERFEGFTRTFLEDTIKKVFSIDFNKEIKLSELINDTTLKQYINAAEDSLSQNDFMNSIKNLSIAFEIGKDKALENIYENYWAKILTPITFYEIEKWMGGNAVRELKEAFEKTENMLSIIALNLDYRDYMNFKKKSFVVVQYASDAEPRAIGRTNNEVMTKEDADFCYNFVLNSFITWEL